LIVRQIDFVVRSTTGSTSFAEVMRKGAENQWIERVRISGLTSDGEIAQQIRFTFDWAHHELLLESPEDAVIEIDPTVPEGEWIAHAIGMIIEYFNEFTRDAALTTEWVVGLTKKAIANQPRVDQELGLQTAAPRRWVSGTSGTPVIALRSLPNAQELGVEYLVASQ